MTRRHRPTRLLAVLLAAAALVLGAGAVPAAAHEGDAVVVVEAAHPAGMSVHYIVRVTWENDGHAANGVTVTATAVGEDGTQLTPVTLAPADEDGRYSGLVEYPSPGAWTVRVTSVDPTGSVEQEQVVAPPSATEAPPEDDTATTAADDGFAPADDDTGDGAEQAASDGSGDDGMQVVVIVIAAVVVLAGAASAIRLIRRHRPGATPGDGDGPSGGGGGGGPPGDGDGDRPSSDGATAGETSPAGTTTAGTITAGATSPESAAATEPTASDA
ncbi:MAG TPA: hypothetical protein VFZ77_13475 [Acidimicrobiales bacterium]